MGCRSALSSNGATSSASRRGTWLPAILGRLGMAGGGLLTAAPLTLATPAPLAFRRDRTVAGMTGPAWAAWAAWRYGRDAGGRGHGSGDHGRQVIGAAELGRDGHHGVQCHPDGYHRGLDRRRAAGRVRRDRPGNARDGRAARNSAGFGAPRYGVKPIVMPKAAGRLGSRRNRSHIANKIAKFGQRERDTENGFGFRSVAP